jgi:membrane protease YdiL (CAAX protease family)
MSGCCLPEENLPERGAGRLISAGVQVAMDSVQRARRGLAIFFHVLVATSLPLEVNIAKKGLDPSLVLPLTYAPAFASIVARIVMGEGFGDISFKLDRRTLRGMVLGVLYPIVVGLPAFSIAWTLGLADFEALSKHELGFAIPGSSPAERVVAGALISVSLGLLAMAVLAIGEEVGWRGYMLKRLIDARQPRPVLTSAVVWALWHTPLVLSGHYNPSPRPVPSFIMFFIALSGTAWVMARLRLSTGSVWPAIVLHAAWNSILVQFFAACTRGEMAVFWASESGVFVAASVGLTVFVSYRILRAQADRRRKSSPSTPDVVHSSH